MIFIDAALDSQGARHEESAIFRGRPENVRASEIILPCLPAARPHRRCPSRPYRNRIAQWIETATTLEIRGGLLANLREVPGMERPCRVSLRRILSYQIWEESLFYPFGVVAGGGILECVGVAQRYPSRGLFWIRNRVPGLGPTGRSPRFPGGCAPFSSGMYRDSIANIALAVGTRIWVSPQRLTTPLAFPRKVAQAQVRSVTHASSG